jgi:hypothetical protein
MADAPETDVFLCAILQARKNYSDASQLPFRI